MCARLRGCRALINGMQAYGEQLSLRKHSVRVCSNAKLIRFGAKSDAPVATQPGLIAGHAGRNKLEGSSVPQFRNWSKLTVLSTFENRNLDIDLGILENMSKLQHVLVQVLLVLLHPLVMHIVAGHKGLWRQRHAAKYSSDDRIATAYCGLICHTVVCNALNRCSIHGCFYCSVKTLRYPVAYLLSSLQAQ